MIYIAILPTAVLAVGLGLLAMGLTAALRAQSGDALGRAGLVVGAVAILQIAVATAGMISTHRNPLAELGCLTGYLGIWWTLAIGATGALTWLVVAAANRRRSVIGRAQWALLSLFAATELWVFLTHLRSVLRCTV